MVNTSALESRGRGFKSRSRQFLEFHLCSFISFFLSFTGFSSFVLCIYIFSTYTLSDLGDLSNLIGWLSRTIQQYSPPSEWIMCEIGVFPIF